MKKNQLLKDVSNVNDAASQVVSQTAGLKGNIKNISVKNGEKNVESIAEKAFKAAIIDKTNVDTTENGQFHTAFNVVDSSLSKAYKAGATVHRTTKKIALSVVVKLIDKHLNVDSDGKDETFSDKRGYDNYSSTELQPIYQHYNGKFIDCDVIDTDTLLINWSEKIVECKLEHVVDSDIVNAEDINMSTIVVSDYNNDLNDFSNVEVNQEVLKQAPDVKIVSKSNKVNINNGTNVSNSTNVSIINQSDNANNINIIVEKNKINEINSSVQNLERKSVINERLNSINNKEQFINKTDTSEVEVNKEVLKQAFDAKIVSKFNKANIINSTNVSIINQSDNANNINIIVKKNKINEINSSVQNLERKGVINERLDSINNKEQFINKTYTSEVEVNKEVLKRASNAKIVSESKKVNINNETNVSHNNVSIVNQSCNVNNINSIIEKNKIKKTNSSAGTMKTRSIVSKDVVQITQNSEKKGITNEKLKAIRQKLNSKKEKLNDKPKSSTAANDLSRMVRQQIVNDAIDSFSSENENNMSSGMASLAGNYVAAEAEKKLKEKTVDKLYDATIGKAMDKVKGGIKRAFKKLAQSIIHSAFMLFQLIVSVIGSLATMIGPMILLPVIIGAVLIGGVFGGIFHLKLNNEEAAKNDSDIRQVIEENENIFGKFSFDKSSVANLGTFPKSYDELKVVFTWMNEENPYPVKEQARIITSQYTLKRTDVEGHAVHYGVDFNAPMGSTLVAIADATIEATGTSSSYGNHVILDFGDGTYALYAHMTDFDIDTPEDNTGDEDDLDDEDDTDDEPRSLQPGDIVKAGDMIGHSGSTGDSTGPHLHLVLSTSPYGNEADSRYDFNEYVKSVWCPDFEFSYDYEQTYGIFENDVDYFREN